MCMDWLLKCHTAQNHLQIQYNCYENPKGIFYRNGKKILKFIWSHEGPQVAKTILGKESKAGGLTLPPFKGYYRAKIIKAVCYWHKDRHTDQRNRIKPCSHSQGYTVRYALQQMLLGKLDNHELDVILYHIQKSTQNELKT